MLQHSILFLSWGFSIAQFVELPISNHLMRKTSWARLPKDGSLPEALSHPGVFGKIIPSKLLTAEKHEFVTAHQYYRKNVHSANMLLMEWDETLASLAQGQAERCIFGHGNLFFSNGTNVGQNVVAVSDRIRPWRIVRFFQLQSENYVYSTNTCKKGKDCEAYIQLVWYKSNKFGCGRKYCDSLKFPGDSTKIGWWNYVCDYSPPGNYPERPFLPVTYETCELCNLSPGTRCTKNQCQYCDSSVEPDCRPFNVSLCKFDNDPCCKNWDPGFCIPNTAYFNYMALNCGATCDSYMCLF